MDLFTFCHELPKIELHAHLNGSLSKSTMLELRRYYADNGFPDKTNAFYGEFELAAGDPRGLADCFQIFSIAHELTTTPKALEIATFLTLKEFQEDGCCYIELRSTPKDTQYMSKRQYIQTMIETITKFSERNPMIPRLIISICRHSPVKDATEIAELAIEFHKNHPVIVVGIDFSGNPAIGKFDDFVLLLSKAREAGLKVALHCGEIRNPEEVLKMLTFEPDRIGHGVCIHPDFGGTKETWSRLLNFSTPVEICLTSNVNTKATADYESHHFKYFYENAVPVIICTDDKGVFATSLSLEYKICAETFNLDKKNIAKLALDSCAYIFDSSVRQKIKLSMLEFLDKSKEYSV